MSKYAELLSFADRFKASSYLDTKAKNIVKAEYKGKLSDDIAIMYIEGILCMRAMRDGKATNALFKAKRFGLPKKLYKMVKNEFTPKWVAYFSFTGSEILSLSKKPDLVLTNNKEASFGTYVEDNYYEILIPEDIVTLHGWMKIVPESVCSKYNIYNGHPGLITKYPELRGKDPQKRSSKYPTVGSVIHKVTREVDAGEVIIEREVENTGDVFALTKATSKDCWEQFIREYIDDTAGNGGPTSYYDFEPGWKGAGDIIEARNMNFNQGNIFKCAFCFNLGRHEATNYERELNKIIYFAKRELKRIKNGN